MTNWGMSSYAGDVSLVFFFSFLENSAEIEADGVPFIDGESPYLFKWSGLLCC